MLGQISSSVDVQEKMLEILRQEGGVPVYKLAKLLGLTYGGAQWHIDRLERRGLVYTVRVGKRRYVVLKGVDLFAKVTVEDVVEELIRALSAYGVELKMPPFNSPPSPGAGGPAGPCGVAGRASAGLPHRAPLHQAPDRSGPGALGGAGRRAHARRRRPRAP